jgi:uncharacterized membrane protein YphA (DoxX/SURF4 family)
MHILIKPGRYIFAIGIMALALFGFFSRDFLIGRPPLWPAGIPGALAIAHLSNAIVILCSVAILLNKKGGIAALSVGILILIHSFLIRHLPGLFEMPWEGILWSINVYKTLALAGGAFIVAVSLFKEQSRKTASSSIKIMELIGVFFIGFFFIMSGFAHFKFDEFIIKSFMPAYIPLKPFWTYFCGVTLIAGGLGIWIPPTRRLAALLSAIMILGWFLLLHIPRFLAAPNDPGERLGLYESFSFVGILLVLSGISATWKNPVK